MSNKIYVIGIGYTPLNKKAGEIISNARIILASNRLLEVFKGYEEFEIVKNKIKVINNVDETIEFIKSQILNLKSQIVLLASGDPMFFGIGRRAVRELGKDMVEILPDLSSIQLAFSTIKEPWDDAFLMSLHGGPDPEKRRRLPYEIKDIQYLLQKYNKIAILTDKENNPTKIAQALLESFTPSHCRTTALKMYVCERLGYPDEKITQGTSEEIANISFSHPNVVIIIKTESSATSPPCHFVSSPIFGLKEDEVYHTRGLITKDEIRAVTIHKLRLPQRGVFWDIGAGSGAISIEAARLCPELKVFSIEKDKEQIDNIIKNKLIFDIQNIQIIEGMAPYILKSLPSPNRAFIGGSGKNLKDIINLLSDMMLSGIIVINASKIETLNIAINELQGSGFKINLTQVNVSRLKAIGDGNYLSAMNPVFIIQGERSIAC